MTRIVTTTYRYKAGGVFGVESGDNVMRVWFVVWAATILCTLLLAGPLLWTRLIGELPR